MPTDATPLAQWSKTATSWRNSPPPARRDYARERMSNPRRRREPRSGTSESLPLQTHAPALRRGFLRRVGGALALRAARSLAAGGCSPFRALPPAPPMAGACRSAGACSRRAPVPRCGRLAVGLRPPLLRHSATLRARSPPAPACAPSRAVPRAARLRGRRSPCAPGARRVPVRRRPRPRPFGAARGRWDAPGRGPAPRGGRALPRAPFSPPARRPWAASPPTSCGVAGCGSSRGVLGGMHQTGKRCLPFLTLCAPFPSAEKAALRGRLSFT